MVTPPTPAHAGWKTSLIVEGRGKICLPSIAPLDGYRYDWPPGEVHNGVAGWQVKSWADDPGGAYVEVWGPDRTAVEALLERLAAWVAGDSKEIWA